MKTILSNSFVLALVFAIVGALTPCVLLGQTDQDCEALKKEIAALQKLLADLAVQRAALEKQLEDADKGWERWKNSEAIKKVLKSSWYSEDFKSELLDAGAKWHSAVQKFKNAIEENKALTKEIENTINDLLNKLANCGKKTESPTPTPSPTSTPSKKKKKHTDHQTSYAPPTPTTPSTTDKVVDVLKTIGGSVSIGVGGGTSGGGGGGHRHDRARGQDRTRTAEKTKTGNKPHTTSKQPPSTHKTVTAGCKCHPCTCSPCTCH